MIDVREFPLSASDDAVDAFVSAFLDIWNAPESLRYLSFSSEPFSESQVLEWVGQAQNGQARYLVALGGDGSIRGIAALRDETDAPFEILGLGVRREWQGSGVGRALILRSMELAVSSGRTHVECAVFEDNDRMLGLLASFGFAPVGTGEERRVDGTGTVVLRARLIGAAAQQWHQPDSPAL